MRTEGSRSAFARLRKSDGARLRNRYRDLWDSLNASSCTCDLIEVLAKARMNKQKPFVVLGASFIVAGCGSMANRADVSRVSPAALDSQEGVVIFSVGARSHCISESTFVSIRGADNNAVVPVAPIGVDVYVLKSEFADHHGLVDGFWLVPGSYYFVPNIANPYVQAESIGTFKFEVRPHETVYLGELYMTQSCGLRTAFVVNDEYERDVQIARKKNPALLKRASVKRLMQKGSRFSCNGQVCKTEGT